MSSFKLFKSLAPKFLAKSSLIFTSSGIFTDVILQLKIASLFIISFSGKFSGNFTLTFLSSLFFNPINCLSKPLMNKSFPSTICVLLPVFPLKSFPSTEAL